MTKNELAIYIASDANISVAAAGRALDSATKRITQLMKKGDSIALPGFGTFGVTKRKARAGRNPATGEAIKLKARNAPTFKASVKLKAELN